MPSKKNEIRIVDDLALKNISGAGIWNGLAWVACISGLIGPLGLNAVAISPKSAFSNQSS